MKVNVESDSELRESVTGDIVRVIKEPDYTKVTADLQEIYRQGEIKQ